MEQANGVNDEMTSSTMNSSHTEDFFRSIGLNRMNEVQIKTEVGEDTDNQHFLQTETLGPKGEFEEVALLLRFKSR